MERPSSTLAVLSQRVDEFVKQHKHLETVRNAIFLFVVLRYGGKALWALYDVGLARMCRDLRAYLVTFFFERARKIPYVKRKVAEEMDKVSASLRKTLLAGNEGMISHTRLPAEAIGAEDVLAELRTLQEMGHHKWEEGRVSGTVYHGGADITSISSRAYEMFIWSNPLHPDVFPGVRKMEAEIIAMIVHMYNGGPQACGTTTSGGTESILMAMKAYRDWGRKEKGITAPEIVAPVSVHCAFDKAAHYFGMKLVHVPVDPQTRSVDVRAVRRAITSNTVAIVGSVPSYPHGAIDDIEALSEVALHYGVGLHVDCCLGGFLIPFMDKAGFKLRPFDFRLPGVTSISCDTHKYGYAPKGSSVVMYKTKELRSYQYFVASDWTGGIYASPTIAGSRPGALLAGCWATMISVGEAGYVACTREIIAAARKLSAAIKNIRGLKLYGNPQVCVVAFGSDDFDIYLLGEQLTKKGWNLNSLQYPSSIHICLTYANKDSADDLIHDLTTLTAELMKTPGKVAQGAGAIYGMAQAVPDRTIVDQIARCFIDTLYENVEEGAPTTTTPSSPHSD
ncbi:sphinganine1-phosphate aldolase BST1, putative [Acanthamoeba castellanii str. Neff]|uniref:sphinganine-1-phosphate aldolase n=1 Tax=Acanthamoeba castellanii (strain ATCC 30010 / Neff) TaxID=1257118 RepID=L8HDH0_ACACF|nr:sphinganine1-phosphate aldolase BST1, putative [Acanthamoeba castellanii str. Neff]ELR23230.1 sphinganine1-phosphate aldolase BST1, putative [Acanthamoeba castellanii str. Neff]